VFAESQDRFYVVGWSNDLTLARKKAKNLQSVQAVHLEVTGIVLSVKL